MLLFLGGKSTYLLRGNLVGLSVAFPTILLCHTDDLILRYQGRRHDYYNDQTTVLRLGDFRTGRKDQL